MTRKYQQHRRKSGKGFTLVEVIVALVILAILAAILIPSMVGWIESAQQKKVVAECRQAVLAAQSLASEHYADGLSFGEADVKALSELPGTVSAIELDAQRAEVLHLTYENEYSVTFCRNPGACGLHAEVYTLGGAAAGGAAWASGTQYHIGDVVVIDGVRFVCLRDHSSGSSAATQNPVSGSNKSTWEVVGFESGADASYFSRLRYAENVVVTYRGVSYRRTSYNPGVSPTPFDGSLYWELV